MSSCCCLRLYSILPVTDPVFGVFAKKFFGKNLQFGPFVAELVDTTAELANQDFILKVGIFFWHLQDGTSCTYQNAAVPVHLHVSHIVLHFRVRCKRHAWSIVDRA